MGKFKHWLKLVVYRFTLSNDELSKCLADRRSMDEFRRKASGQCHFTLVAPKALRSIVHI